MSAIRCRRPKERTSTCPLGGAFEQLVLLAVVRLAGKTRGQTVLIDIRQRTCRRVSLRAVYATLARLEQRGLLERRWKRPRQAMNTRGRHTFRVTVHGRRALRLALRSSDRMRRGLPGLGRAEPMPSASAAWMYGRIG